MLLCSLPYSLLIFTFGYVAPEYANTGLLNEKSDVYSFGDVLLEAITGRDPVDYGRPAQEVNLVDWLKMMVGSRRSEEVVDPNIETRPSTRALKRALLTALRCVDPDSEKRPKMGQVVGMLESEEYPIPREPLNVRIKDLMSRMTLEEKIGQLVQIDSSVASAEVMKKYFIGSILGGGGSVPAKHASAESWINMVNDFQKGSLSTRLGIPMIYGIDAVHGHNNVYKATIFPHNIGLGATRQVKWTYYKALQDVYTIEREVGKLDGIKVGIVGDLANGRTVRLLAYLLSKYHDVKIYFVSPEVVKMKDDIKERKQIPDTLDYEELVSKALKLPLLSNSYCNVVDTAKATAREVDVSRAANKGVVKDEYFPDLAKDEPLEPVPPQDIGRIEKPNGKGGSAGKLWEDKKANAHDDFSVYPRKDNSFKGEKGDDIAKADSNSPREEKL
ncbi:hypothetical protein F0562_033879 [Nyssa sinensis]|uniref:non-specific serine/threonine protein kinase n=1 Tax=Nyssa sinensis TaxID=561372 RepID=A0A5J5AHH5_9ASTE|nr:hypothetical protein F0562_033879 [Nyssa sinensis]